MNFLCRSLQSWQARRGDAKAVGSLLHAILAERKPIHTGLAELSPTNNLGAANQKEMSSGIITYCLYKQMYVWGLWRLVFLCVCLCVCLSQGVFVKTCVHVYIHFVIYICIHLYTYRYTDMRTPMRMYAYVYIYM